MSISPYYDTVSIDLRHRYETERRVTADRASKTDLKAGSNCLHWIQTWNGGVLHCTRSVCVSGYAVSIFTDCIDLICLCHTQFESCFFQSQVVHCTHIYVVYTTHSWHISRPTTADTAYKSNIYQITLILVMEIVFWIICRSPGGILIVHMHAGRPTPIFGRFLATAGRCRALATLCVLRVCYASLHLQVHIQHTHTGKCATCTSLSCTLPVHDSLVGILNWPTIRHWQLVNQRQHSMRMQQIFVSLASSCRCCCCCCYLAQYYEATVSIAFV